MKTEKKPCGCKEKEGQQPVRQRTVFQIFSEFIGEGLLVVPRKRIEEILEELEKASPGEYQISRDMHFNGLLTVNISKDGVEINIVEKESYDDLLFWHSAFLKKHIEG